MKIALLVINQPKMQDFAVFDSIDKALAEVASRYITDETFQSFFYDEVSDEYWYIPCTCHEGVLNMFICEMSLTEPE